MLHSWQNNINKIGRQKFNECIIGIFRIGNRPASIWKSWRQRFYVHTLKYEKNLPTNRYRFIIVAFCNVYSFKGIVLLSRRQKKREIIDYDQSCVLRWFYNYTCAATDFNMQCGERKKSQFWWRRWKVRKKFLVFLYWISIASDSSEKKKNNMFSFQFTLMYVCIRCWWFIRANVFIIRTLPSLDYWCDAMRCG